MSAHFIYLENNKAQTSFLYRYEKESFFLSNFLFEKRIFLTYRRKNYASNRYFCILLNLYFLEYRKIDPLAELKRPENFGLDKYKKINYLFNYLLLINLKKT